VGTSADRAAVTRRPAEVDTDRAITVPNALSALRLCGVPVVLWLILGPQADVAAVVVLAVAGITDWLDGWIARRWHQRSRLGQVLDPLADRLYILATIVGLALRGLIPWWLVIVLVARDVVMALLIPLLRRRGYTTLPVHFLGKAATFCLLYAFPLILLGDASATWAVAARVLGWAFALWGTGLYWYAALLYVHQTWTLLKSPRRSEPT
jgi:cardiolipin synthase